MASTARSIRVRDANGGQTKTKKSLVLKELVDLSSAALNDDEQFLFVGDNAEPAPVIDFATTARHGRSCEESVGTGLTAERLRELSDDVSRIAATLARLSIDSAVSSDPVGKGSTEDIPAVTADTLRRVILARRMRARYFSEELFADPAWDMLLELLYAEISQLRVPISSLCSAAAVPATTALRWLTALIKQGLFIRRADKHDGRRTFVELAPQTSRAMRRYFAEVGQLAVI